jgi:hypothetical protein
LDRAQIQLLISRGIRAHLNSIRHHHTKTPHTRDYNPLYFMAVGKVQPPGILSTPRYYLFEKREVSNGIADNGHKNIGSWIDRAAQAAGR